MMQNICKCRGIAFEMPFCVFAHHSIHVQKIPCICMHRTTCIVHVYYFVYFLENFVIPPVAYRLHLKFIFSIKINTCIIYS